MGEIKNCAVCGRETSVPTYRLKERNYCSTLCANKGKPRRLGRPDVKNEHIADLYLNKDFSSYDIARELNVSVCLVCDRLKKMGITKSPYGHEGRNGKRGTVYLRGYPVLYDPSHPRAKSNGYVKEHIVIVERMLGRPLSENEVVHHINGDKTDNTPENLMVFPDNKAHMRFHWAERKASQTKETASRGANSESGKGK